MINWDDKALQQMIDLKCDIMRLEINPKKGDYIYWQNGETIEFVQVTELSLTGFYYKKLSLLKFSESENGHFQYHHVLEQAMKDSEWEASFYKNITNLGSSKLIKHLYLDNKGRYNGGLG